MLLDARQCRHYAPIIIMESVTEINVQVALIQRTTIAIIHDLVLTVHV